MLKKNYIGETFPWMYRLKSTCYYSSRYPVEMDHIERRWLLSMWLVFGKENDRYIRCYAETPEPKAQKKTQSGRKSKEWVCRERRRGPSDRAKTAGGCDCHPSCGNISPFCSHFLQLRNT